MTLTQNIILLLFFCVTNNWARSQADFESNNLNAINHGVKLLEDNDGYFTSVKNILPGAETVRIQVYYESLDPDCISFILHQFAPVFFRLFPYIDFEIYPYGNTKIILDHNHEMEFKCEHGPEECYGNKLHACALDPQNLMSLDFASDSSAYFFSVIYNICLMNSTSSLGSDDESADRCGKLMHMDSKPIKECAKGVKGKDLLLDYYFETGRVKYKHVPHVLINGNVYNSKGNDFFKDVCAAFTDQPPPCNVH